MRAARKNKIESIKVLIEKGAALFLCNARIENALQIAEKEGATEVVSALKLAMDRREKEIERLDLVATRSQSFAHFLPQTSD
jgi:hypothetical protein